MERNIIELSETYQLGVSDNGFIVYQLRQEGDKWRKNKGTFCKTFEGALDFLINCEAQNENVTNLEQLQKVIENIREEVSAAICKSQAELY